jgi:hypothetical protein
MHEPPLYHAKLSPVATHVLFANCLESFSSLGLLLTAAIKRRFFEEGGRGFQTGLDARRPLTRRNSKGCSAAPKALAIFSRH